jgi:hypothetical protein
MSTKMKRFFSFPAQNLILDLIHADLDADGHKSMSSLLIPHGSTVALYASLYFLEKNQVSPAFGKQTNIAFCIPLGKPPRSHL